jgi:hypothetical protein
MRLGLLSSWVGLGSLGLKAPEAWVPFQGITPEEWIAKLRPQLGGTSSIVKVKLHRIADYEIIPGVNSCMIYLFAIDTDNRGELLADEQTNMRMGDPTGGDGDIVRSSNAAAPSKILQRKWEGRTRS